MMRFLMLVITKSDHHALGERLNAPWWCLLQLCPQHLLLSLILHPLSNVINMTNPAITGEWRALLHMTSRLSDKNKRPL